MNDPRTSNKMPPESREPCIFEGYHRMAHLSVPDGCTHVGPEAFAGYSHLVSVALPRGLKAGRTLPRLAGSYPTWEDAKEEAAFWAAENQERLATGGE